MSSFSLSHRAQPARHRKSPLRKWCWLLIVVAASPVADQNDVNFRKAIDNQNPGVNNLARLTAAPALVAAQLVAERPQSPPQNVPVWMPVETGQIQLCQALGPAAPHCIQGVDCYRGGPCGELGWEAARSIAWQSFAQGEYVGHFRQPHVLEYRLRPDDDLEFVYRFTRIETSSPYQLEVGDEINIESITNPEVNRTVGILPDGTITLHLLGQVRASRRTIPRFVKELNDLYVKYYNQPAITVTPLKTNTRLEDLRDAVDSRFGSGGQARTARVTPEGTIALPAVGSVPVQGMTLNEVKRELNERYTVAMEIEGIEVTPVLVRRAPRFVYVVGEVRQPGRYTLEGPTTAMQAVSLGGGWNVGANLRQVVVFRRGDDWRLMATMLDLRGALYGDRPCPADEIWLNDSDIVVVPKSPILICDEFIDLVFTRGIYGVFPFRGASISFAKLSTL